MSNFDPFTATLEEAQAQSDADESRGAVDRYFGARELLHRRAYYEKDPLAGMACCAMYDLVAPEWLAKAYLRGYYKVSNCVVGSWDDAFGRPFPKGKHLASMRRAKRNRLKAASAFSDILRADPDRPVDKALFEEIGTRIGEGATRAEELYREAVRMGMASTAEKVRGFAKLNPAKLRKPAGVRGRR